MIKVLIGSMAASVVMMVLGFLFWATPLSSIALQRAPDPAAIALQQSMAQTLTASGTGTYTIPSPDGSTGNTILYARGPVATVHFSTAGFPATSGASIIGGFVLDFVVALLIGAALIGIADRVTDFPSRARLVAILAVAASALIHVGEPIFFHYDLRWSLYNLLVDALTLAAGGLVIARWFLPAARRPAADALQG